MADEQVAQGLRVDTSTGQSRVEAAPSAPVGSLEAQVDGRRSGSVRAEDGLCEFEKSVAPAVEAFVERAAEVVESIGRFHDAPIMHPPTATRTPYLSAELKRKLRKGVAKKVRGGPLASVEVPTTREADYPWSTSSEGSTLRASASLRIVEKRGSTLFVSILTSCPAP